MSVEDNSQTRMDRILEQITETKVNLRSVEEQVRNITGALKSLNDDFLSRRNEVVHIKELLEGYLQNLNDKIKDLEDNVSSLQKDFDKINHTLPFIAFLKQWATYIGLFIASIIIVGLANVLKNYYYSSNQKTNATVSTHPPISSTKPTPKTEPGSYNLQSRITPYSDTEDS